MKTKMSTFRKVVFLVLGAVGLNWLLQNLNLAGNFLRVFWGFLFPFILGFIIAFLLNIPMKFIERVVFRGRVFRMRRILSYLITLLLLAAVVVFVVFLVVPQLLATIKMLMDAMPGYIANIQTKLRPYEAYIPQLQSFIDSLKLDWGSIASKLFALLQSGAGNVLYSAFGVANSIISGASSLVIGLIFSAYLLLDKEHLSAQVLALLRAYLPEKARDRVLDISRLTAGIFSKFVSGQCIEAVAIGSVFVVVLFIGGFDYSLLIGVLIGFLSLIPIFGAFIGCVIGALLILVSSGLWRALAFVIVFIVVQQLDGNFMYPRIVGSSVGLPAVWVLAAVTIGGGLMGITGMLVFIPLSSVVYTLIGRNTLRRLEAKGLACPDPHKPEPKPKKRGKRGTDQPSGTP